MTNSCKNCNYSFVGKFCNQCGQKASVKELKLKDVLHESWHSITHTDSGILKLIKDLFFRPKSVYINYFSGQRKKYFSPVTFFLISVAILLFLGTKVFDYEDYKLKTLNEFGRYTLSATRFKTVLLLPFEILVTWLLFYKQFNLAKNIVFWLYLNGYLFTIKIILIPFYFPFIQHKSFVDTSIILIQYVIIFVHLILVFGNRKWLNIILLLFGTNLIFISDNILTAYLLFEDAIFKQTGTKNIFELILKLYQL
ncbi:MAG: DUF3667 domain-containing protein [Emticicia sp.]|nr:DUF3667 domain-containing protein [Emticicia sp.]